jgi:hypothetical protein
MQATMKAMILSRFAGLAENPHPLKPVVEALGNPDRGGRLVINAIRREEGDKAAGGRICS